MVPAGAYAAVDPDAAGGARQGAVELAAEMISVSVCDAKGTIVFQPAEWGSPSGYYFSCAECGNASRKYDDAVTACQTAIQHLEEH